MPPVKETLLVFECEIDALLDLLNSNVIRMASNAKKPWNPLRDGKEIQWDGEFAVPNSIIGVSLAASIKQLSRVFRPGKTNWLLAVDRLQSMPDGLMMKPDSPHHWSIVVTKRMHKSDLLTKFSQLAKQWKIVGRYIRYE